MNIDPKDPRLGPLAHRIVIAWFGPDYDPRDGDALYASWFEHGLRAATTVLDDIDGGRHQRSETAEVLNAVPQSAIMENLHNLRLRWLAGAAQLFRDAAKPGDPNSEDACRAKTLNRCSHELGLYLDIKRT